MANGSKTDIWMPFYIGDYLASTGHLSPEQNSAYLMLIFHQWRNGPLPNNWEALRNIARLDKDAWSIAWSNAPSNAQAMPKQCKDDAHGPLMDFFEINESGKIFQPRCARDKAEWNEKKEVRSKKSKNAAYSRWKGNAPSNAQAMPKRCPSSSSSSIKYLNPFVHGASADGPAKDPDQLIYAEYPRKEGHRAAIKQIQLAVVRLGRGESGAAMNPLDARRLLFRRVREYARSPAGNNPDKSKIPMPKTWFSQSRYLDESANWEIITANGGINGNSGNRSQQRTDGNIAAARAAIDEIVNSALDEFGGSPPGFGEQGDASDICDEVGAVPV